MKSYLSFSVNDSEHDIVTYLSQMLNEKKFSVTTNHSLLFLKNINQAHIFIGLITATNKENNEVVLDDWQSARSQNIPSLLLVDKKTLKMLPERFLKEDGLPIKNIIPFNKAKPMEELKLVKEKINQASYQLEHVW